MTRSSGTSSQPRDIGVPSRFRPQCIVTLPLEIGGAHPLAWVFSGRIPTPRRTCKRRTPDRTPTRVRPT